MGVTAAEVGNWPGDIDVKGPDLMERYKKHALSFDSVKHQIAWVKSVAKKSDHFELTLDGGETVQGKTLIFATGSQKRHLGVPGEDRLSGKGVTYCATCDAFFYKGKDVAVLGGGDSAVEGAAIAAQVAKKVYLVHRREEFRAEPYWVDKVKEKTNVEFVLLRNVTEILGDQKVSAIQLDKEWNGSTQIPVDGVFIEIGATPATELPKALGCDIEPRGFLNVNADMSTNIAGAFGAGDVTNASNHFAQFATAAGEASVAANSVFNYLQQAGGEAHKGGSMGGG